MKKCIRRVSVILLAFALLGSSVVTAQASEYVSSKKSVTVYGRSYQYWSGLNTISSSYAMYFSHVTAVNGTLAGYIGQRPRLFTSGGILVAASDWMYNAKDYSAGTSWSYPAILQDIESGEYYYSRANVKFYTGNGYTSAYAANATPNLIASFSSSAIEMNENGEIFGSELFLSEMGIEPDLIKTLGDGGNVGFVKSDDLNYGDDVSTPDEALEFAAAQNPSRTIPVYMSDGETIIDTFTVYSGQLDCSD